MLRQFNDRHYRRCDWLEAPILGLSEGALTPELHTPNRARGHNLPASL
jgi:hypothetical protein